MTSKDWNAAIEAAAKVVEDWKEELDYTDSLVARIRTLTRQPTTPTTGEDDVEVTQADRDAAADWYGGHAPRTASYEDMCQRFARHRLAAISPTTDDVEKQELIEALRGGLVAAQNIGVFPDVEKNIRKTLAAQEPSS